MYNIFLILCIIYIIYNIFTNQTTKKELLHSATIYLIGVNIIVFIITLGGHLFLSLLGNNFHYTIQKLQLYRLLTSMFCHSGILHLMCNMISLINVGLVIETMYGKKNMLITYFTSGIIGGLISIIIHGMLRDGVLSVGASGAICGLIGALLASLVGDVKTKTKIIILTILPILLIGFSSGNIDNISHFSCMFVGVIIGLILKKKK